MRIYRGSHKIPVWEKVLGQYKFDSILDMPKELYEEYLVYFGKLKFTPKVDRCTFYLTSAGNYGIDGLDQEELESILTSAYCSYVNYVVYENRHESFNGICYSTRKEFIEDCQDMAYAKCVMSKEDFKRYCTLRKRLATCDCKEPLTKIYGGVVL